MDNGWNMDPLRILLFLSFYSQVTTQCEKTTKSATSASCPAITVSAMSMVNHHVVNFICPPGIKKHF